MIIIVPSSHTTQPSQSEYAEGIAGHWPELSCLPCPEIELVNRENLFTRINNTESSTVVVLIIDNDSVTNTYKIIDELSRLHICYLLLLKDVEKQGNKFAPFHWVPLGISHDLLAARLETMLVNQQVINDLKNELALNHRLQGGVSGEMERMHEEMELAATVQRDFLPRELPVNEAVEFGILYRPSSYVSGDIYDVTQIDDERIGFFLADATGHGVPAALMTVLVSRGLNMSEAAAAGMSPGETLSRLNDELASRSGCGRRFATAICGILNTRTYEATLACAGHPPPLIVSPQGVREVEVSGSLLGVFPDEHYDNVSVSLIPGERLVLFTDGFELAFPTPDQDLGRRRLPTRKYMDEFANLSSGSLPDAIKSLESQIDAQAGSLHQVDDLTVLALGLVRNCPAKKSPDQNSIHTQAA